MAKIIQLSQQVANMIAAGEVVERPASVVKELLENAVDAGAGKITIEIRDGGMTFIRVTDDGCGMHPEDAATAFLRHATSKLRTEQDLAAIETMGFRGEALAAIASVSRIDLLTKPTGAISGTALSLEGGNITEQSEAGCPDGTTIIVRDLFFNTPARMKFMKSDAVEAGRITAAVQQQALAHPHVAYRFLRDGKEILHTPGSGDLHDAIYSVWGKEAAKMIRLESAWEQYRLCGLVSKPTDSRPSRNLQTFFVNNRPVKNRLLIAALEEAYRNQIMVGKFPACVLYLTLPASMVDVNVHPAKTEVKFQNEKAVFDCIHYGVLGALNQTADRPQMQFKSSPSQPKVPAGNPASPAQPKPDSVFRTMSVQEYKAFSQAVAQAPQPSALTAAAVAAAVERSSQTLRDSAAPVRTAPKAYSPPVPQQPPVPAPRHVAAPSVQSPIQTPEAAQQTMDMPHMAQWRLVGELYHSYILVEQGEDAFLIDKHAAHERILFEKLKSNQEAISAQALLVPLTCSFSADICALLLANRVMLDGLGFEVDSFGENTLIIRQIPMDLEEQEAVDTLEQIAADLTLGRRESASTIRDEVLHTVACKAAIKAGWITDEKELMALVRQVMEREDLKYCPHGRPICISLSKKQLEKQFKRA